LVVVVVVLKDVDIMNLTTVGYQLVQTPETTCSQASRILFANTTRVMQKQSMQEIAMRT